tara:strand:- start:350 stop:619 length:270 start_codon:yes stop_codon:yes gene_type:complete
MKLIIFGMCILIVLIITSFVIAKDKKVDDNNKVLQPENKTIEKNLVESKLNNMEIEMENFNVLDIWRYKSIGQTFVVYENNKDKVLIIK